MTLDLDIDHVYIDMLERIEEQTDGDAKRDLESLVENAIHESFQQIK